MNDDDDEEEDEDRSEEEEDERIVEEVKNSISRPLSESPLSSFDDGATYVASWIDSTKYTENIEKIKVEGEFKKIFEDDDIIVIEKPSYLSTTNTRTLKDSVRSRLETLPFLSLKD